ncbi:MAG: MTAP family purine nucleoside phosphorylase [Verrucomicrobiota bacterium]
MKLAIVSGTSINDSEVFKGWRFKSVETPYGEVVVKEGRGIVLVNRHNFEDPVLPHAGNYKGYVDAICKLGVDTVLTMSSVGSFREELPPGTFVSCSDYASFAPMTFFEERGGGYAPEIANDLLEVLKEVCPYPIEEDRIYFQSKGPRFETRAEVRILKNLGCDVVGMTFANEADLMLERGLKVNPICMVDNFAHGLGNAELSMEQFRALVAENQSKVDEFLAAVAERFGE